MARTLVTGAVVGALSAASVAVPAAAARATPLESLRADACKPRPGRESCRPRDARPPRLRRLSASGGTIRFEFDEALRAGRLSAVPFEAAVNGERVDARDARAAGRVVTVALARPHFSDDTITVSYDPDAWGRTAGLMRDAAGNLVRRIRAATPEIRSPIGCSFALGRPHLTEPGEGPTNYEHHLRPVGEIRAAILFADFPDAPGSIAPEAWAGRVAPVISEWYRLTSYGRLTLTVTPITTWFRLGPLASYASDPRIGFNEARFVDDALAAADPVVDFSRYSIVYVIPPPTAETTGRLVAGIATVGAGRFFDGTEIRFTTGVGHGWPLDLAAHVLIHETGHFFGLPDLYDELTADTFRFAGLWDVMSNIDAAAGFTAWQRWKLGWLEGTQLRCLRRGTLEETLAPLGAAGGVKALVVPTGPETALVLENRQQIGEWAQLCNTGVLAYTVARGLPPSERGWVRVIRGAEDAAEDRARCGPLVSAPFTASFELPEVGVSVELATLGGGAYRVRVTRGAT